MEKLIGALKQTAFADASATLLKDGYNHEIYSLQHNGADLIAHVGKSTKDLGSDLYNFYRSLRVLEYWEKAYVPKAMHFSAADDVLIETSVGEKDVELFELSNELLEVAARQLADVHTITYEDVVTACNALSLPVPTITSVAADIELYGVERFAIAEAHCPDQSVLAWIRPKLAQNLAAADTEPKTNELHLQWGDIGSNFRAAESAVWFIDWEFSAIARTRELAYIKIHSHPTDQQFADFVSNYARYSGVPVGALYEEIAKEEHITRVHDVIWAAMKWGQHRDNSAKAKHYEALTKKRMRLYEAMKG